jgi:hypothetical protein
MFLWPSHACSARVEECLSRNRARCVACLHVVACGYVPTESGPLFDRTVAIASWQRGPIVVEVTHEPDEKLTTYSLGAISSKDKTQPVLVGEEGPELFVPDQPGAVPPHYADPPPMTVLPPGTKMQAADEQRPGYGSEVLYDAANSGVVKLNPKAFGDWLDSLPESENVEDRSSADSTREDSRPA